MDIQRAKSILEVLEDGINPVTGEILPMNDSCNQVEVVRALHTVLKEFKEEKPKQKNQQVENAGKSWSKEEEENLCRMFDEGSSQGEIARQLKRTRGAIKARLVALGKIQEEQMPWTPKMKW